jgi:hypothetical protein
MAYYQQKKSVGEVTLVGALPLVVWHSSGWISWTPRGVSDVASRHGLGCPLHLGKVSDVLMTHAGLAAAEEEEDHAGVVF